MRASWSLLILACVAAAFGTWVVRDVRSLRGPAPAVVEGVFPRDGHFPGAGGFTPAPRLRVWGSWDGDDRNRGSVTLGPFRCPQRLEFGVAGYPANERNGVFLELVASGQRERIQISNAGERWQYVEHLPPAGWRGRAVRLIAVDDAIEFGGWLAVTEPFPDGGSGIAARGRVLRSWVLQLALLALVALGAARWLALGWPAFRSRGAAIAVFLFLAGAAFWAAWQHVREPHFTTMLAAVVGGGVLVVLLAGELVATAQPLRERLPQLTGRLSAWWAAPSLNPWVIGTLAVLLFLRKPHSLHTAQLYAEDGSIFLAFNDALGAGAIPVPYMGYLHLIPRLTAWAASHLLDCAWWPEFYNGVAFAIWVAVIARTFSTRFPLQGKPWLALAFFLGPQTGEVLFTITNVQWITAFVLIQQVLVARPANQWQRVGDPVMLALAGLTGPFSIVFAPLFAWRFWRERNVDTLIALLVVVACAGIQGWFVFTTGEKFEYQVAAFRLWPVLEVVARRLVIWPVAGSTIAWALPGSSTVSLGLAVLGALLIASFRVDAQRELRARLVVALLLILAVGMHRIRPDVWDGDNLHYGDRYFYIPRVLLGWLLVLQFQARPRAVAWAARALAASAALVHVPDYIPPAPPDYHWKENCDPVRRGVPGAIHTLPEGWWIDYRGRAPR